MKIVKASMAALLVAVMLSACGDGKEDEIAFAIDAPCDALTDIEVEKRLRDDVVEEVMEPTPTIFECRWHRRSLGGHVVLTLQTQDSTGLFDLAAAADGRKDLSGLGDDAYEVPQNSTGSAYVVAHEGRSIRLLCSGYTFSTTSTSSCDDFTALIYPRMPG